MEMELSELEKVDYLDCSNLNGRITPLLPYKNEQSEWNMWIPSNETELTKINSTTVEGLYVAKNPELETDYYLGFIDFIYKYASWSNILTRANAIVDDFFNLCTVVSKIDTYYELSKEKHIPLNRYVATEIEYLFVLCRSLFDLLQETIAAIWGKVNLLDTSLKKKELPNSFRKIFLKGETIRTNEEIKERYQIPIEFADFYLKKADFFLLLRKYRDRIVHSGQKSETIFLVDKGFAVLKESKRYSSFGVWNEDDYYNDHLASLKPVIYYIISNTIESCNEFVDEFCKVVNIYSSIIPDHNIYIRSQYNQYLFKLEKDINERNFRWWS